MTTVVAKAFKPNNILINVVTITTHIQVPKQQVL
jgi:hypothetical protein